MSFQVDPDALTAASRVATRQHGHIGRIDDYISSACSDFGAFSGVLALFRGSYESAVATAHDGLRDSRAVADRVRDAFVESRDDYLDTDQETYDRFRALSPTPADFPPYDPAGSGNSTPGGPLGNAPADGTTIPPLEDKHPGVTDAGEALGDKVRPGHGQPDLPPWLDPKKGAENWLMDRFERRTDEYQYYRSLGYSDEEALAFAKTDGVAGHADTLNHERINRNAENAYQDAYDQARSEGLGDREARDRANDAYADSRSRDSADHVRRGDIGRTAATYHGVVDEGGQFLDNIHDLAGNVEEIGQSSEDLERYDGYESRDEDESAQEWAGR